MTELSRQLTRRPLLQAVGLLELLAVLTAAGAGLRVLIAPGTGPAAAAWIAVTTALSAWVYRQHARAGSPAMPARAWQPGQQLPEGLPSATAGAAGRYLAAISSRRRGAWLEIARCEDPVRHGWCQGAGIIPSGSMIRVVLGEHMAERPQIAAFTLAHESRHAAGWAWHLPVLADRGRFAAWLIGGWAVPWPWLLAAVAAIQAAHTALCWAVEIDCDIYGARAEGRSAALEYYAWFLSRARERGPGPAWQASAKRAAVIAAGVHPHPPARLRRAIVRTWVPGEARSAHPPMPPCGTGSLPGES